MFFFQQQGEHIRRSEQDALDLANQVEGFGHHRSSVVPWLRTTGIVDHVRGLKKDEIRTALAILAEDNDQMLQTILDALQDVLHKAHRWCFDGPDCMLTWPCRVVLSRFQSS